MIFFADNGVIHHFSCVKCPQENSVAEKKNISICSMLLELYTFNHEYLFISGLTVF